MTELDYTQEGQDEGEALDEQQLDESRPDWLPSQFDNVEALAKSYEHAQQLISRQGSENAELRAQLELAEQPQFDEPAYDDEQPREPTASELLGYLATLAEQAQTSRAYDTTSPPAGVDQLAYTVEQEVQARNPDYAEHRGRVVDLLTELPQLVPASLDRSETVAGIEYALDLARREAAVASLGSQESRLQKLQAQSMSGGGGRPPAGTDDDAHWEGLKAAHSQGYAQRMSGL